MKQTSGWLTYDVRAALAAYINDRMAPAKPIDREDIRDVLGFIGKRNARSTLAEIRTAKGTFRTDPDTLAMWIESTTGDDISSTMIHPTIRYFYRNPKGTDPK